jgi:hypothetical protein
MSEQCTREGRIDRFGNHMPSCPLATYAGPQMRQAIEQDELRRLTSDTVFPPRGPDRSPIIVWDERKITRILWAVPQLLERLAAAEQECDALRRIVDHECPIGALDLVTSLRIEKQHMMERIAELEAAEQNRGDA